MAAAITAAARVDMSATLDHPKAKTRKPACIGGTVGRIAMMAALGFTLAACEMQNSPFASRSASAPDQIAASASVDGEMADSIVEGEITSAALLDSSAEGTAEAAVETSAAATPAPTKAAVAKPARQQRATRLVERDVEAPQVFQTTDTALWDGRPSLGGVWIASPDTKDPERVIMRNPTNGKFVIGALFRRERDNPGPTLQISSDAAEALGILAGQPVKLSVVALRREETPANGPAPTTPMLDSNEAIASAPVTEAPAAAKPAAAVPVATATAAVAAPTPKRGNRAVHEAAAATLLAAPAGKPAPNGRTASAPRPAAPVAAVPAAAAVAAPATGGRAIQIGIFSVEANAKRASDALAKAGIPAQIRSENTKGKTIWSVTSRGDGATVQKIKAAGFGDAYLMK